MSGFRPPLPVPPRLACVSMTHHHVTAPDSNQLRAPAAGSYSVTVTNTEDNGG